jgi:hypothetical protein
MRVPRKLTPGTNVGYQAHGYQRAAQVDLRPITTGLDGIVNDLREKKSNQEKFDVRKAVIEEANFIREDMDTRKEQVLPGAPNFSGDTKTLYDTRRETIVEKYRALGYSPESLQELELGLSPVHGNAFAQSLDFQNQEYRKKADEDGDNAAVSLSQYAAADPVNGYASAVHQADEMVDLMELLPSEKIDRKARYKAIIGDGARKAIAEKNPELVLEKLLPKELISTPGSASTSGWQGVAVKVADELGLQPEEVATVFAYETGGTFSSKIMGGAGGKYMGLIQFGPEERAKYGITENSTPEEWSGAILGFMKDRGFRKGMSGLDFYSTILAGRPGKYDASDGYGTVREHYTKMQGDHLKKGSEWLAQGEQTTDPVLATGGSLDASAKTGIAILDDSTGAERMQMVDWAQSHKSQSNAEVRAALQVAHENALSGFMNNGAYAGKIPTEAEYKTGFGDAQGGRMFAELQATQEAGKNLAGFKTMAPAAIHARVEAMKPSDPTTQAVDQRIYEAMQRVEQNLIKQRADDPGAYVQQAFPKAGQALANAKTTEQRRAAFTALANAHKQIGTVSPYDQRPFSKEQAADMVNAYKTMPAQNRVAQLHEWMAETRGTGIERGFWRQLHESGAGADVTLMAVLWDHPERDYIVKDVIGKEKIANDKALQITREWQGKLHRGQMGDALAVVPSDYSNHIREVTAALFIDSGGSPVQTDDPKAQEAIWAEAFRRAVGGMRGKKDTGFFTDDNGTLTILPPTVSSGEFENWKDGLTPRDLAGAQYESGRPASMTDVIDNGSFVMVDNDTYEIRMKNGQFLRTGNGNSYRLVITPDRVRGRARRAAAPIAPPFQRVDTRAADFIRSAGQN